MLPELSPEDHIEFKTKLEFCIKILDAELQQSKHAKLNTRIKDLICESIDNLERCKDI